jgi:hypothetical protein
MQMRGNDDFLITGNCCHSLSHGISMNPIGLSRILALLPNGIMGMMGELFSNH